MSACQEITAEEEIISDRKGQIFRLKLWDRTMSKCTQIYLQNRSTCTIPHSQED